MLVFHLLCEFHADILNRHRELLVFVDVKPERLHFAREVWIRLEVEQSRAFTVFEKSFTVDLACIARDGEVNVLSACLREVNALKRACRPVGTVVRLPTVMMLDERELDFAR